MSGHAKQTHGFGYRAAGRLLPIILFSVVCLHGTAPAEEGKWSVGLSPAVVPFLSGSAGSGESAPEYRDAFDTGYGIMLEFERSLSPWVGIHSGIGLVRHKGKQYQGIVFDDLNVVPISMGGRFRYPVGAGIGVYLNADLGAAHLSSVGVSSGGLGGNYWNASWVFLFCAGAGLEYRAGGPWSASLQADFRSLGKPDSALGAPSNAGSFWTLPVRFAIRYSF